MNNEMMLIVDDVELNREILKTIFDGKYEILEAESGEEALAMIEACEGSIDIVLLDLVMGDMTGFDVLRTRKTMDSFKDIPVVVITGSDTMQDQINAFNLGASEYIAKPFIPEIVLSRVNNVMGARHRMVAIELEAARMKIKSELDEMTGLSNKTTSEITIDHILKNSENSLNAMIVIDIDNFKTVNDTSGHQAGDHVIRIIANLIASLFRKTDVVGRIGGDEFIVLMTNIPNMEIARSKVNEMIQMMRYKPNLAIPEYVTLSIGLASNDKLNTNYASLFKKADHCLYEAKEAGRAQYREYGIDPIRVEEDDRSVAVLISDSRNVCSSVHALIPTYIRIIEILKLSDLDRVTDFEKSKTRLMYADISDRNPAQIEELFTKVKALDWISIGDVFAICEEGNIPQYMAALETGIADMLTAPIDHEAFKRRTLRQLDKRNERENNNS